ncbi:MAG: sulfurtransferase [Gammaproteobacteria bacterium]|nr:sulfurtransferase [Gammaproteobacteria bacterium]
MSQQLEVPLFLDPAELKELLGQDKVRVVDLCGTDRYARAHIPGAVSLEYSAIVAQEPPVMGLLPNEIELGQIVASLGITKACHVIAYDCEGGGRASRFLWTLMACGQRKLSLLNGGMFAWEEAGLPLSTDVPEVDDATYPAQYSNMRVVADRGYIQSRLTNPENLCIVDTRSTGEYEGSDVRAKHGGHIPGAVHFEWTDMMDREREMKLLPEDRLRSMLEAKGITPDKEIIVYCHTHHRSAFSFWALKKLGYQKVRGYVGSWSDWGNQDDTAIES